MNWLDPIGAICSLSSTFLFTQVKRYAWIIASAAIVINIILYWQKGIYARFVLDIFYLFSMISGYIVWTDTKTKKNRSIQSLSFSQCILLACLGFGLISTTYYLLCYFTNATLPLLDAITTIGSLIAQCLLVYKFIQCWIIWFFIDILVAVLQFKKEIPFHATVHLIYTAMAIYGYFSWRNHLVHCKRNEALLKVQLNQ